jgi:hypothetical protein
MKASAPRFCGHRTAGERQATLTGPSDRLTLRRSARGTARRAHARRSRRDLLMSPWRKVSKQVGFLCNGLTWAID